MKLYLSFSLFFIFICQAAFTQVFPVKVTGFRNCGHQINLDSIKAGLQKDRSLTIVIVRADKYPPNGTISPLYSHLKEYDTSLLHIFSFERIPTNGADFCEFSVYFNSHIYPTRVFPPKMWLMAYDHQLLDYVRMRFRLVSYRNDSTVLFPETVINTEEFLTDLNRIISSYDSTFLDEYIASIKLPPDTTTHRDSINQNPRFWSQVGFSTGIGTFTEKIKMAISPASFQQSYESLPFSFSLEGFYRRDIGRDIYISAGLSLWYFKTGQYSRTIESFRISSVIKPTANYSISPYNPVTVSSFAAIGGIFKAGRRFKFNKLCLNIETGLTAGKIFFSYSKANFRINQATPVKISNSSGFKDKLTAGLVFNSNIGFRLSERISFETGILGMMGNVSVKSSSDYYMVESSGNYVAFENAAKRFTIKNLGITAGVIYDLK